MGQKSYKIIVPYNNIRTNGGKGDDDERRKDYSSQRTSAI
jgi:hypothetical protein